jgi:hypothetical protein
VKINKFTIAPVIVESLGGTNNLTFSWDVSNPGRLELDHVGIVTGTSKTIQVNPTHREYTLHAYGDGNYADMAIAKLVTYDEFIVKNDFTFEQDIKSSYQDSEGWWDRSATLTADVYFDDDGWGSYECDLSGQDDHRNGNDIRSVNVGVAHSFTWKRVDNIITANGDGLTMILEIRDDSNCLYYQQPFDNMVQVGALFTPRWPPGSRV